MTAALSLKSFSLAGALAVCVTAFGLPAVGAEDPIAQALQKGSAEWDDGFDAAAVNIPEVRTATPILSQQSVEALQVAIAKYSDIVARGGWPLVPADQKLKIGMRAPAIVPLRQRLVVGGDLAPTSGVSDVFDTYVFEAVKRFQERHGVPVDGIVGDSTFAAMNIPAAARLSQLSTNLTRLKMLTAKIPERFVMVNIPAAKVEAVEGGTVISRHTAIAGKVDRPSPILTSKISEVNFNPFWTVPVSIVRRDLIGKVRENPNYLTEFKIRIIDPQGNEVSKEQIDWTTEDATKYTFRQDPSDINSLGSVRINFANKDGVYMHDTPLKGLFNDEFRFASSGCVRIQNIRELIIWLLRDTPEWSREQIDAMFTNGERIDAKLKTPVPVYWSYVTAWAVSDGAVHFRSDVYGLDGLDQVPAAGQDVALTAPDALSE